MSATPAARSMALATMVAAVTAHGMMTFPKPRNAIDGIVAPFNNWSWHPNDSSCNSSTCKYHAFSNGMGSCPHAAKNGMKGALNGSNGQACYWFSNGCTIGCDKCDGTNNHLGHGTQKFIYTGPKPMPAWVPAPGTMKMDPKTTECIQWSKKSKKTNETICEVPFGPRSMCGEAATTRATICDSKLRTVNTQAECGTPEDIYYYSPWRAPGSAPTIDACGVAGGRFPGQGAGPAGALFYNSSVAKQGDVGSKLPKGPAQATWKAGMNYEVGWTVQAHHGGGYAYRLAPADGPLTEAEFAKTPLDFIGPGILRWDGDTATQMPFEATTVSVGTFPNGSQWRKNPLPRSPTLWQREGPSFEPICEESEACKALVDDKTWANATYGSCRCSGHSNAANKNGPYILAPNLEIVDVVKIPADLTPGDYVLQWRWDCEETAQVWESCADVTITA